MEPVTIAFATSTAFRAFDEDLPLIQAAADQRAIKAEILAWDDPNADWRAFDAVVVRSCWDYIARREEFLGWAASVPRLHNSREVIEWNTDKVYLRQLEAAGIPIIETRWDIAAGDDIGSPGEWVVKPTVSAGSRNTARWHTAEDVYAHSAQLTAAGRTSMTQPYISSVDNEGETAMLFIGGVFSHAIRKGQLLEPGEGVVQDRAGRETIDPRMPSPAQREIAQAALAAVDTVLGHPADLLYARVDLVTDTDGSPIVIELELTEPSLFLPHSDGGALRLVDAVLARI
ncbi:MAG: hypothetical protein JWR83_178 [Aeromicrobium sp.]|nr:hypothetical protein [Aeromicrobium sp.]